MDVQAYLRRIRYTEPLIPGVDRPGIDLLRALHRAHLFTVPFENLDIPLGRKIICDEARFLHKIVNEQRGGFCYELNGAFAALLRVLGFRVTLLSGRVARADGGYSPEFDHLTLRVDLEEPWLADVGFGECFLEPLRLEPGMEQPQNGRIYRLTSRLTPIERAFRPGGHGRRQVEKRIRVHSRTARTLRVCGHVPLSPDITRFAFHPPANMLGRHSRRSHHFVGRKAD